MEVTIVLKNSQSAPRATLVSTRPSSSMANTIQGCEQRPTRIGGSRIPSHLLAFVT